MLGVVIGSLVGALAMFLLMGGGAQVSADCPSDPGKACGNGDVNADGKINVADAIYILGYLFAKGPSPAAIECPTGGLPVTGQTECYTEVGEIPCDDPNWPGQDGFYQKGCPKHRFSRDTV